MSAYTLAYYSGTGNSRYIAEKLAAALGCEVTDINEKLKNNDFSAIDAAENLILVTPTYCWRIPRVVEKWAEKVKFKNAVRIWFVMNCGSDIGNACSYNRSFADRKKLEYMGTAEIVMPENYIAMFKSPCDSEAKKIIAQAQPHIDFVANELSAGRKFAETDVGIIDKLKSGPVNPLFYRFSVKATPFTVSEKCVSCGKCASLCPLNNIELRNGKPVWGDKCTHCMACICRCPSEAIEYGKKSQGKNRYHI